MPRYNIEYEVLKKTKNGDSIVFWLPIGGSYQKNLNIGVSTLAVWLEYDPEYGRFLGDIRLGPGPYHLEVVRYLEDEDEWKLKDADDADNFICAMGDGDRPQSFEVEGFPGYWLCVVYPFF